MAVSESTGFIAALFGPQSFEQIFANACIEIRDGDQPASADAAVSGTLLGRITRNGGPWSAGSPTNGLNFNRDGRLVVRAYTEEWRLDGIATGIARWARLVANAPDHGGASLVLPRIDFAVGEFLEDGAFPPGVQLALSNASITPSTLQLVNQFVFTR